MSHRRRCFTVDEALAQLMQDDDEDFFGKAPELSEEEEEDSDAADEADHGGSDVDPAANSDSDDGDDDLHFLDRDVDVRRAARRVFVEMESDLSSEGEADMADVAGGADEGGAGGGESPGGGLARHECGCSKNCLDQFDAGEIEQTRLTMRELEQVEHECLILGILESLRERTEENTKGKKRKRSQFTYRYQGVVVCQGAFRHVYELGKRKFENLQKHLAQHGLVPRVHGNKGRKPKHAFTFPIVENVVKFVKHHAEVFGLPHPAPLHGRDGMPPVFLPASQNFKSVHRMYVAACQPLEMKAVGISSFRAIWHHCLPHIRFMTPRTDVCNRCELLRRDVVAAVGEDEKLAASAALTDHVLGAQREREMYKQRTLEAQAELKDFAMAAPPPVRPCSAPLTRVHYTFDFAQNVSLPYTARQVGPIYFKSPRKVQIFGVNSEGIPKQVNYLLDEADTIGKDGTKSHGANTVVSLLHHFFEEHGHGEKECHLHADNCAGQNKNKTLLAYLAWRVLTGRHYRITISFMVAGHTRCLVDGCFGLLKRAYRRSDCFTMEQLAAVVDSSAACNVAQVYPGSTIRWRSWDTFLLQHFRPVPGISKLHHCDFKAVQPGQMVVKETVDGPEAVRSLLKTSKEAVSNAGLPAIMPAGGLSAERQAYLFKEIRQFVPPAFQDELCPEPQVAEA